MNNEKISLTPGQFVFLIFGILVGVYIFRFPGVIIEMAHQDAWIAVFISSIYPLYIASISCYIAGKHPSENILALSKRYLGKTIGNILNTFFLLPFFLLAPMILANLVSLIFTYGGIYVSPNKIIIVVILITAYTAYNGSKCLGKMNEIIFYLTMFLVFLSVYALGKGSFLNLMPVFTTSFSKIIKASKEGIFSYLNVEVILLIHPYLKGKKSIKRLSFVSIGLVIAIYFWVVFISIYFLGYDTASKNIWPYIMVIESVNIPIVANFRTIFIISWEVIQFKIIADEYFFSSFILKDITGIKREKICIYLIPIFIILTIIFSNEMIRKWTFDNVIPILVIFNVLFFTLIAIITSVKKSKAIKKYKEE